MLQHICFEIQDRDNDLDWRTSSSNVLGGWSPRCRAAAHECFRRDMAVLEYKAIHASAGMYPHQRALSSSAMHDSYSYIVATEQDLLAKGSKQFLCPIFNFLATCLCWASWLWRLKAGAGKQTIFRINHLVNGKENKSLVYPVFFQSLLTWALISFFLLWEWRVNKKDKVVSWNLGWLVHEEAG